MNKYRTSLDIVASILHCIKDGARKTQIMYQANLSYVLLVKYLKKILRADLVYFDNNYYRLTTKGQQFLERFDDFSSRRFLFEKELAEFSYERELLERMCISSLPMPNNSSGE